MPSEIDYYAIYNLSVTHGLIAIVLDGIEKLPESERSPKEMFLNWIGEVLQSFEKRFFLYRKEM